MSISKAFQSAYESCSNILGYFFRFEYDVSEEEAFTRIEQEAPYLDEIDRRLLWGDIARKSIRPIHPSLVRTISQFEKEDIQTKIALDLGCGKSASTLYLLQKEWQVIAVDSSQKVLDELETVANSINPEWIRSGQLTLQCSEVDRFKFPKNVTLVLASAIFPYVDPKKMRVVWDKIHTCLSSGGRVIGHFWKPSSLKKFDFVSRVVTNAWFIDIGSVRGLLEGKKYQIEVCRNTEFAFSSAIQFVGKKGQGIPTNRGLFPIYSPSYSKAVRNLPSHGLLPHASPFLADAAIRMREISKLPIPASGTAALAQSFMGKDPSFASKILLMSMGVWIVSKAAAGLITPRAISDIERLRTQNSAHHPALVEYRNAKAKLQETSPLKEVFNPPPPLSNLDFIHKFFGIFVDTSKITETPNGGVKISMNSEEIAKFNQIVKKMQPPS